MYISALEALDRLVCTIRTNDGLVAWCAARRVGMASICLTRIVASIVLKSCCATTCQRVRCHQACSGDALIVGLGGNIRSLRRHLAGL